MKKLIMKRKKKTGFTLIELLAVILILGIIALIAIPTVNGVIEESRMGAATSSASQYIKSFEEKMITSEINGVTVSDGDYTVEDVEGLGLDLSGTKPEDGYLHVSDKNVDVCELRYGNYVVNCDGDDVSAEKYDSASWIVADNSSYIAKVYYNPTNGSKCTVDDFYTNLSNYSGTAVDSNGNKLQTGLKSGCMVWYAYKDNGDGTVNMILNHNTTNSVKWSSLTSTLSSDTTGWNTTARILSANELFDIVGASNFGLNPDAEYDILEDSSILFNDVSSYDTSKISAFKIENVDESYKLNPNKYSWLLENSSQTSYDTTLGVKYTSSIYDDQTVINSGFWTSSAITNFSNNDYVWVFGGATVMDNGKYAFSPVRTTIGAWAKTNPFGIRPVITVSKDSFK